MLRWAPRLARAHLVRAVSRRVLPPEIGRHLALDVVRSPEGGREVLPPGVGEDRDDHAFVELAGELAGDVDDGPGGDAREDALLVEQRADAGDGLGVRDEQLPIELGDVEDWRYVAVFERAQSHDGIAGQRLGRGDDDLGEA